MSRFGHAANVPVGARFVDRSGALAVARNQQSGMVGGAQGTESIVLNGGYVDDIDLGSLIIYTGQGGQSDTAPKVQVRDQVLQRGNLGLKVSYEHGLPVRVVRGFKGEPAYSPPTGYRYDGLYRVTEFGTGTSNEFLIYRATLEAIPGEVNPDLPTPDESSTAGTAYRGVATPPVGNAAPGSKTRPATAMERMRAVSAWVKNVYSDECQLCGTTLTVPGGTASAGAHIRPLGGLHAGPDTTDNVLCLCHNCHYLFDNGGVVVGDDLGIHVYGEEGVQRRLRVDGRHKVARRHLHYHRRLSSWAGAI
jgi:putative restriction endonuclease